MGAYIYLGSDSHLTSSGVYRERLLRVIISLGTILLASEGVCRALTGFHTRGLFTFGLPKQTVLSLWHFPYSLFLIYQRAKAVSFPRLEVMSGLSSPSLARMPVISESTSILWNGEEKAKNFCQLIILSYNEPMTHYIAGIDEAGRGAWAGPVVAWGVLVAHAGMDDVLTTLVGVTDSKLLSHSEREWFFEVIEGLSARERLVFSFAYREAVYIDSMGIREANRQCMQDILFSFLTTLAPEDTLEVWIDGSDNYIFDLWEPCTYLRERGRPPIIETESRIRIISQIRGDLLTPVVSLGSIVAKVTRDRIMIDLAHHYPEYGFDRHKWYGTRAHQEALHNYGINLTHRKSYAPVKRLIFESASV